MSEAGPSTTAPGKADPPKDPPQRINKQAFLQMIQQRKNQVYAMPRDRKLLKLAIYSACQDGSCNCCGWKAAQKTATLATVSDPCQTCGHLLSLHISHLNGLPDEELNRLLGMVVDTENIFNRFHREQDVEVKHIYYNLFRLLKTSIVQLKKPQIEQSLGTPPFETPTIAKGVLNFVCYKFNHLAEKEWQTMYSLAQMFLHSLNQYTFESPTVRKQTASQEEVSPYRRNYTRWMVFCYVPMICDSLRHFDASVVFGITMLRSVFKSLKKELMDKFHLGIERMQSEERASILPALPRFLDLIEEEIYTLTSPIWEEDFKATPPPHLQATLERKRQELEKQRAVTGSPKLGQAVVAQADSTSEPPATPTASARKNGRDTPESNKTGGEPLKGPEPKRRKLASSAATVPPLEDPEDISLPVVKQIVADLDSEEKSTNRAINVSSLFKETTPLVERAKAAEEKGQIKVVLLSNSLTAPVSKQTMLWLLNLRTLFLRQLPSMPVDYITRLVYDPKHKTLALIKDNKPIGGICFRSFSSQGFSEVVFCAVRTSDQFKGYGAHMMNHLKEYHIRIKIHNLLTFADKNAIVYFKKQGFSQNVTLDPSVYQGFIKYYDGAIFMHCTINPRIVYTELSSVLRLQKEVLKRLIDEKKDMVEQVHPGLTCFKEGLKSSIPIESLPGIRATGWKPAMRPTRVSRLQEETSHPENLHKSLKVALNAIKNHKLAWPFLEPVKKEDAQDYFECIKYPMDLKTMGERLKSGYYTTRRLFIADMLRIFNNCRIYNRQHTEYYKCANDLDRYFQTKMKEMGLWDK
uniref:histone acetyltransferase n=4 Tax=Lygus hesperus TaxID=30085 RepID=A0A146KV88_LYGHE